MEEYFDLIIFGGGTVGNAIALDASSRGLKVAIVEKGHLGRQTNNASLGLIQRDPKYLYTDVDLVLVNATDCGLMKEIAGPFLKKQNIIIPIFPESKYPLWFWDSYFEAFDKFANLSDSGKHLRLSRNQMIIEEPLLREDVIGGIIYDEWIADPLDLTLALAGGAVKLGATFFEQSKIIGSEINKLNDKKLFGGILIEDNGGKVKWIFGSYFINATGPWAPEFPKRFGISGFEARLTRGTSIIINNRLTKNAVILFNDQNKYINVLPYKEEYTLIGPTNYDVDPEISANPGKLKPEDFEIDELLNVASKFLKCRISRADIADLKCGLRPQPNHKKIDPYHIIHAYMIINHGERDGVLNFCSVFGGKLSNQIRMAKETVDFACQRLKELGKLKNDRRWKIPNIRITREDIKIIDSCRQDCQPVENYYLKKYALSYKDKIGEVAFFKRIKSLIFLAPFILKGFLKEIRRRLTDG